MRSGRRLSRGGGGRGGGGGSSGVSGTKPVKHRRSSRSIGQDGFGSMLMSASPFAWQRKTPILGGGGDDAPQQQQQQQQGVGSGGVSGAPPPPPPPPARSAAISPKRHGHHPHHKKHGELVESLSYETLYSDVYRAHRALDRYNYRGSFWNSAKREILVRYLLTALVGVAQGIVAYFTNVLSTYFISSKFDSVNDLLDNGHPIRAFFTFLLIQTSFAIVASIFVWIEPVSAGSGIPEVKCFLNGIDLPNVTAPRTLLCKVLGVICSVSAGLPVGKEGPMVHSGAVVATTISSGKTRNDSEVRDFVACGAAAGVCTAFSAPIGGILFSLEEGASYWAPSLTWRTFLCTMIALTTLYCLDSIGSAMGKIGFNKLFSFGNFIYEGGESSFAVYELFLFILVGAIGGTIGAVFNNTNERITHWRMKNINHSKQRRFLEVVALSMIVSCVSFLLPLMWVKCTPLPENPEPHEIAMLDELVSFRCESGKEYNELASLYFTEPGVAIRQLFHLHRHAFSDESLFLFFLGYVSMAIVVYGIAVPSGLFVPTLLTGAAFGRLFGNLAKKLIPGLAYSNTYALVGAASVLGGCARMTISLTVILLECTGNEQYVLPLMLTLMTARLVGGFYNDDLYHIHIHLKRGVEFLEAELGSATQYRDLLAGDVMGENVVFFRPVEKVGTIVDILQSCGHSTFPVVDTNDGNLLVGTVSVTVLCSLLKHRSFGRPVLGDEDFGVLCNYFEASGKRFFPIAEYEAVEEDIRDAPSIRDIRIASRERELLLDLRPYLNKAPITVQETASVERAYQVFRSLGLRFLPVVNKRNQVVGTITRSDVSPHGLKSVLLKQSKRKK